MLSEETIDWTLQWKQQGLEEGRREGRQEGLQQSLAAERTLLQRQVSKRFGEPCAQALGPLLEAVQDQDCLAEIGEWIITCPTGEAFLTQVRQRLEGC